MDYAELGWQEAVVLGCARQEGVLEALSGEPRAPEEVAGALGMDVRAVRTLLGALAEMEILDEEEGRFRLREEHRGPLLDRRHPEYAGGSVVHRFGMIRNWSRMPEVLRSGEPVRDNAAREEEDLDAFIFAMRRRAKEGAGAVAWELCSRLPENPRILDVGGGPGTYAEAFARRGAEVTVLDLPEVVELMREYLEAAGVRGAGGDFNESLPEGPFEAAYLGNVSHIYGPAENRALFRRVRGVLVPGGVICIRDFVRGVSRGAAMFAVNMLVHTRSGGTYSAEEYRSWLEEAGFEGFELAQAPAGEAHLIFARRA
ncbi:methyltransferase domain-containing protein [Rubrobacter taiwanensis]|jgi:SAM-dependent methyltransferase|uniref:Methyltransferase domain-containing protein n=1 Tax=Rubrobacter taiwanensis TaxID=185139 RepID=A0A4R1BLY2_9ACTN|nr:methyltransferase [Rubrobacter taiwanensis]TCJ18461.1 methyltransferase domain-containing protein [Rubrobacter taiwanensis]